MASKEIINKIKESLKDKEQRVKVINVHMLGYQNKVDDFLNHKSKFSKDLLIEDLEYSFNDDYMKHLKNVLLIIDKELYDQFIENFKKLIDKVKIEPN